MSKTYAVQFNYQSSYTDGGRWAKGDKVELDDDVAAAIERDCPGVLQPASRKVEPVAPPAEPETRAPAAPAHTKAPEAPEKKR